MEKFNMITINCYSCNKQFSFLQTEEGKSFCCPNCGRFSLVSSKIVDISLPENLNQSREKFAVLLTPIELYKIKENIHKIFFRRLQFSSIAIVLLVISCFLILYKSEKFTPPSSKKDTQILPLLLSSTSTHTSSSQILQNDKIQSRLAPIANFQIIRDKNKNEISEKFESAPINLSNRNMLNKKSNPINTVTEKTEIVKPIETMQRNIELSSNEVNPKQLLNKPELLEINILNISNKNIFIKHITTTNLFLVSLEDYPGYIEGEDYLIDPLSELFIKVKSEKENNFSLIYFGEKKGQEFRLNNENLRIILKFGKQNDEDTIEYSIMSKETSTVSGILHNIPKAKEIVLNKEEAKKIEIIKEKPVQKEEREDQEEKEDRRIMKVVNVYNFPIQDQVVYRSFCSDCDNYYTGLHSCNSTYLNSFSNVSYSHINLNSFSLNHCYIDNSPSYLDSKSTNYYLSIKPVNLRNSLFNRSHIRVIKR